MGEPNPADELVGNAEPGQHGAEIGAPCEKSGRLAEMPSPGCVGGTGGNAVIVDAQVRLWKEEAPDRPWPAWGGQACHLPEPLTHEKMSTGGFERPPSPSGRAERRRGIRFPRAGVDR
jgi:hypothetical protein